ENDSYKNRSDDKGPEPEAITVAKYNGRTYVLLGLERQGGIMVFDISNPHDPFYVNYINNRNFSIEDAESEEIGDLGIEDIIFINTGDYPIIASANEVSGTVSLFGLDLDVVPDGDCGVAVVTPDEDKIMIAGLTDQISNVYIFDGNNNPVFACEAFGANCDPTELLNNLDEGFYQIYIETYDGRYNKLCDVFTSLYVGANDFAVFRSEEGDKAAIQELIQQEVTMSVFPNPARNYINVDFQELAGQAATLEVFNMLGQQLLFERYDALPDGATALTVKGWSRGTYTLSIRPKNGKAFSRRFVVE
ncbi:MAG: T9SS type A sorting domain-containing protein, partial [Bacteroidota bacterium]